MDTAIHCIYLQTRRQIIASIATHYLGDSTVSPPGSIVQWCLPLDVFHVYFCFLGQQELGGTSPVMATGQVQRSHLVVSTFDVHIYKIQINLQPNCNKFYCNLTFCKLNTYLILTNAYLVLWRQNAATNKNI